MLPTLNANVNLKSTGHETTTVHKWNGSEWIWIQVPSKSYHFELADSSTIKVLISDASDLDHQSLANATAKTFAGLPAEMRRPLNGEYDFEFAIMDGFGGYYTGFNGVSNIVLNDLEVWNMSYGPNHVNGYGHLEELIAHELAHASVDKLIYNQPDWQIAVSRDAPFWVSQYAQDHPNREDVAETIVPLISIILYNKPANVEPELKSFLDETIAGIPSRYKYIAQNIFNTENYECLLQERGWLDSSSGCESKPEPETESELESETKPELEIEPENYKPPSTNNQINGTKKDNDLIGSKMPDFMDGKKGNDTLRGRNGDDALKGNKGNDILKGSKGADYLDGSKGMDTLIGGKGADVFQISKGLDIIEDFNINQGDKIALDIKGKYSIINDPNGVLITASSKKQLFLDGIDYNDFTTEVIDLFVQPA